MVLKKRINTLNIDISHFKITSSERLICHNILCKNSKSKNATIKKYLFDNKLKENKCENCGFCGYVDGYIYIGNVTLDLHHIDGDPKNNELDNLQILCPNCHRLTGNFGSKNKREFKKLKKSEIISLDSFQTENDVKNKVCKDCGIKITRNSKRYCLNCYNYNRRKVKNRPSKSELNILIKELGYVKTGKKFGVSDTTIRKWLNF